MTLPVAPLDLSFLRAVTYAHIYVRLRPEHPVRIPEYPGSSLRGALGELWHRWLCAERTPCLADCRQPVACAYAWLFERGRGAPGGREEIKPYVLAIAGDRDVTPDEVVEFRLTLFGDALRFGPSIVRALSAGPFPWLNTRWIAAGIADETAKPRTLGEMLLAPPYPLEQVGVLLLTPVDFTGAANKPLPDHFLQLCLDRAMRVHDSLFAAPGVRLPFMRAPQATVCVRQDLRWITWTRTSRRQQESQPMQGWLGEFELQGDVRLAWPLLRAAEVLHVGRNGTHGQGQIACRAVAVPARSPSAAAQQR